jgi:hypothetical protein
MKRKRRPAAVCCLSVVVVESRVILRQKLQRLLSPIQKEGMNKQQQQTRYTHKTTKQTSRSTSPKISRRFCLSIINKKQVKAI